MAGLPAGQVPHERRGVAAPTASNFVGRSYHSSIVIGNYVYIDGGEIAQLVNNTQEVYPQNHTLSIDLRHSWTNDNVTFNVITKNAPVLNHQALWANGTSSFYQWGGEQSSIPEMGALPIPDNSLWRFDPDGQGAGTWTPFSVPSEFSRVSNALYTSGNSIGYLFGGYRDERTAPDLKLTNWPSSPGLISYNMADDEWTNQTSYPEGSH